MVRYGKRTNNATHSISDTSTKKKNRAEDEEQYKAARTTNPTFTNGDPPYVSFAFTALVHLRV